MAGIRFHHRRRLRVPGLELKDLDNHTRRAEIDAMAAESNVLRFSLIVPAFNEARYLPRLLDSVEAARAMYARGRAAVEVIVADNASTDRTGEVASAHGCRVVRVPKRSIAAARNAGARSAVGSVLAFVDADSRIHPETFDAIDEALATGRCVGGASGVTMERWSMGIRMTYLLFLPMVYLTGMDTGVVFCRREDFERVGGYDEQRRFAEDVEFLTCLKRLGRSRRQRLARLTAVKAVASTRKFDEHGDWHYFSMLARLGLCFGRGRFQDRVESYWYRPSR